MSCVACWQDFRFCPDPSCPMLLVIKNTMVTFPLKLCGILRKGKASQQERGWGVHSKIQGEALKIRILGLPQPPPQVCWTRTSGLGRESLLSFLKTPQMEIVYNFLKNICMWTGLKNKLLAWADVWGNYFWALLTSLTSSYSQAKHSLIVP